MHIQITYVCICKDYIWRKYLYTYIGVWEARQGKQPEPTAQMKIHIYIHTHIHIHIYTHVRITYDVKYICTYIGVWGARQGKQPEPAAHKFMIAIQNVGERSSSIYVRLENLPMLGLAYYSSVVPVGQGSKVGPCGWGGGRELGWEWDWGGNGNGGGVECMCGCVRVRASTNMSVCVCVRVCVCVFVYVC